MSQRNHEASSNGRTADFGSAYEGSNPSASANPTLGPADAHPPAEVRPLVAPKVLLVALGSVGPRLLGDAGVALREVFGDTVFVSARHRVITPKGLAQKRYVQASRIVAMSFCEPRS